MVISSTSCHWLLFFSSFHGHFKNFSTTTPSSYNTINLLFTVTFLKRSSLPPSLPPYSLAFINLTDNNKLNLHFQVTTIFSSSFSWHTQSYTLLETLFPPFLRQFLGSTTYLVSWSSDSLASASSFFQSIVQLLALCSPLLSFLFKSLFILLSVPDCLLTNIPHIQLSCPKFSSSPKFNI